MVGVDQDIEDAFDVDGEDDGQDTGNEIDPLDDKEFLVDRYPDQRLDDVLDREDCGGVSFT